MPDSNNNAQGHGPGGIPMANATATAPRENKFDRKTAEAEFARFCEENDLDCDMVAMTDEEKKDFKPIMDRFVKACMRGRVEADGVNLNYTVSEFSPAEFRGKVITIKRPDGRAFIGMDGYKDS